jgi:hypothetical protein
MRLTIRRAGIAPPATVAAAARPAGAPASPATTATAQRATAQTAATTTASRCLQSQLLAWVGEPGDNAAGSTFYQLELSNTSGTACTLFGYPGVSALTAGSQDGSAADRTATNPPALVTLAPGATAHSVLQVNDTGVFDPGECAPVTADTLRVFAPGDFNALEFPFAISACSAAGPVYLHVTAVAAGTGIPGVSQ